ncbi:hypothetical protein [Brachybacterium hainanense]|uniref:DUF4190 domain-containing protein n=1 Tax=Brachybacterium hainanense TaxID=1541174 RepID=A0ABV6RHA2_9MICO
MTNFSPSSDIESIKKKSLIAMIVGFVCGGVIPGVLGLLGYLKADTEPQTAQKFTKWAWIVFAIIWGLNIILWIAVIALGGLSASMSTY